MKRSTLWITVGVIIVAAAGGLAAWRSLQAPDTQRNLAEPPMLYEAAEAIHGPNADLTRKREATLSGRAGEAPAEGQTAAAPEKKEPLPPLVPGNPLTDDKFVEVSVGIVIAALGLKDNADWEANMIAYMEQTLEEANITEAQYEEYATALHGNLDRGRAVAERIVTRVERKVGTKIAVDKLPMFKFDPAEVKKIEEKMKK